MIKFLEILLFKEDLEINLDYHFIYMVNSYSLNKMR